MPKRFFHHGELPVVLLALLAARPMNGYELMSELRRVFRARYRPSPGTVYPALEALEAGGLVAGDADGNRTVYALTEAGTETLAERADLLAALELRKRVRIRRDESLDAVLRRFVSRLEPLSGQVDAEAVAEILDKAALKVERLDARVRA